MNKEAQRLYDEREKRISTAIELKVPDRVPVMLAVSYFPATYVGGLTVADSYNNHLAWKAATRKTFADFDPDIFAPGAGGSGNALGLLKPKLYKWPGDGVGVNSTHQLISSG